MATVTLGKDCKLFYDASLSGAPSTGSWTEVTSVRNVSWSVETAEIDVTTRANNGWTSSANGLKSGSIEFDIVADASDTAFAAVVSAWNNGTDIGLAAMDGAITSDGWGLAGEFKIQNVSVSQTMADGQFASVTAKPAANVEIYDASASS